MPPRPVPAATLAALLGLLCLASCTPLLPGGAARTPATAVEAAFSSQQVVARDRRNLMVGQVFVLRQNGRIALTADLGQQRHSGQVRLRILGAWHDGQEVPFRRTYRSEAFCIGHGDCQGYRTGTFVFTAETFEAALRDGLEATLVGPDGVVTVLYPPAMFAEARDNARARGILP